MPMPEDTYRWRYRLFASVDISGSTAYKGMSGPSANGRGLTNSAWVHVFNDFFSNFPQKLKAEFERLPKAVLGDTRPADALKVWKFVGDEILLVAEVKDHSEVACHLIALKNAVAEYERELQKFQTLSLKATAWGAGFPVTNVEVEVAADGGPRIRDYLGPSIDLGFRLCRFADGRRIPISADLAYLLLKDRANSHRNKLLHFAYSGREMLKGVGGGSPYPLIWIDRMDGEPDLEDKLWKRTITCDTTTLLEFVEDFYERNKSFWRRPFIEGDSAPELRRVPPELEEVRRKLRNDDVERGYEESVVAADEPPPSGPASSPPLPPDLASSSSSEEATSPPAPSG